MRAFLRSLFKPYTDLVRSYHSILSFKWLALGIVVGAMTGLGAVAFYVGVEALGHVLLRHLAGFSLPAPAGERLLTGEAGAYRPWLLFVFLGGVGLLTGWLVQRFVPQTRHGGTDGTDSMIKAFHRNEGHISPRCRPSRSARPS
jgi:CIC family chloride channel protein